MKELIKKLEKNKEIQLLLKSFEEEFENNFEIADDIDEFSMITYRDTIFRIWLFSPIVEGTYMSPYYIINRIAQSYKKGDYSIAPHIKIIIKANNINFETKWNIYSKVENPVMDDLNKLAKHCNPTIVKRESNRFVIDGGETFIDEISYRSGYYIDYLLELSLKLNIIKEIKSIGCQCYQLSELYSNYDSLSNEEKINKIQKIDILDSQEVSETLTDISEIYSNRDNYCGIFRIILLIVAMVSSLVLVIFSKFLTKQVQLLPEKGIREFLPSFLQNHF